MSELLTTADLLVAGLQLPPLDESPHPTPPGTCCALTGQPISVGYPRSAMTTDATNEFLDHFRGDVHGWVSDNAARCYKNSDPKRGNVTARTCLVFEDGTYYWPMISAESAAKQGRPCWSALVRQVWPVRKGQRMMAILTTDMKRRLWPRARVGILGERTPIYYHDADTCFSGVMMVDWDALLLVLGWVEQAYQAGFVKRSIRRSLWRQMTTAEEVGLRQTQDMERFLSCWRGKPAFMVAVLIAQKELEEGGSDD